MRVQLTIEIDTRDPRFHRLIRLIEQIESDPHSPAKPPGRGDAWEPPAEEYPPDRFDDPEGRAPARPTARPDRGDAWEPPAEDPDEDAPRDGRQLLGWASKQIPDAKGAILSFGKKKGLASKVVEWTPQQVAAAYRFARARSASTR